MAPDRIERRLSAIMSADMVGYSRLMEADETGTIARQRSHRSELIDSTIEAFKGRIVRTTGDGMLSVKILKIELLLYLKKMRNILS